MNYKCLCGQPETTSGLHGLCPRTKLADDGRLQLYSRLMITWSPGQEMAPHEVIITAQVNLEWNATTQWHHHYKFLAHITPVVCLHNDL